MASNLDRKLRDFVDDYAVSQMSEHFQKFWFSLLDCATVNVNRIPKGHKIPWDGRAFWEYSTNKANKVASARQKHRQSLENLIVKSDQLTWRRAQNFSNEGLKPSEFKNLVAVTGINYKLNKLEHVLTTFIAYCVQYIPQNEVAAFVEHNALVRHITFKVDEEKFEGLLKRFTDNSISHIDNQPATQSQPPPHQAKNRALSTKYSSQKRLLRQKFLGAEYERTSLNKAVDDFISSQRQDCGYVMIEGGAGVGKSSVMATLLNKYQPSFNCVWHFLRTGSNNKFHFFIEHIFFQLSESYDLQIFDEAWQSIQNTGKNYETFLTDILYFISENYLHNTKLLLFADALDELDDHDPTRSAPNLNRLTLPTTLPENVYIIASSRDFYKFIAHTPTLKVDLSPKGRYQREDIRGYLAEKAKTAEVQDWLKEQEITANNESYFIEKLSEKSGNTFIYLYYVFQNIQAYDLQSLPDGINDYYAEQLSRLLNSGKSEPYKIKLALASLINFPPEFSVKGVAVYVGESEPMALDGVIRDWLQTRLVFKNTVEGCTFLSLFHASFRDFLLNQKYDAYNELETSVHSNEAHLRLAQHIDNTLVFEGDSVKLQGSLPDSLKNEVLRYAFEIYFRAGRDFLSKLTVMLTSYHFCDDIIQADPKDGKIRIIQYASKLFFLFMKYHQPEKADSFVKGFADKITPFSEQNPLISQDTVQQRLKMSDKFSLAYATYLIECD